MITRRIFTGGALSIVALAATPLAIGSTSTPRMLPRPIGSSDETLPVIGLGNSKSFTAQDLNAARNLIDVFLEHGGGYIDLAGPSRFNVGAIAQEKKGGSESLFLGNYLSLDSMQTTREFAIKLAKAQGKPMLDLANSRDLPNYRSQVAQLKELKEAGLARHIGIARFGPQAIEPTIGLIKDGLVDFVQINYSMLEPLAADRLLPLARDHGVAVVINRPFMNGNYFNIVKGHQLPAWASEFDCNSWAQFSLKYILANPAVNCVLTETTKTKHAVDNLEAGFGRLPNVSMQKRMQKHLLDLA